MMSSSEDENSATADRVEKKSIDEAIASFAMLVRIECVFILYACRVLLCASERRGGLGNRFFASSSCTSSSSSSHKRSRYKVF